MICHYGLNVPFCSIPNLQVYIVIRHVLFKNKQFYNKFFILSDGIKFFSILDLATATSIKAIDEIGAIGVAAILKEVNSIDSKRNSSWTKWSEKDRHSTLVNTLLTQPVNVGPQDAPWTSPANVPITSPKNPIWPSRGRFDLTSLGRADLTSQRSTS